MVGPPAVLAVLPIPGVTRLTLVVPAGMTFTDTFRVALVLAPGVLTVACDQPVYVTLSGKLHGEPDDD